MNSGTNKPLNELISICGKTIIGITMPFIIPYFESAAEELKPYFSSLKILGLKFSIYLTGLEYFFISNLYKTQSIVVANISEIASPKIKEIQIYSVPLLISKLSKNIVVLILTINSKIETIAVFLAFL